MHFPRSKDIKPLNQLHVLVSLKPSFNCMGFMKDLVRIPTYKEEIEAYVFLGLGEGMTPVLFIVTSWSCTMLQC